MITLEQATQVAVIVAMGAVVFKAFSYPVSNFFRSINPFYKSRQIQRMSERMDELEMQNIHREQEIKECNKKISQLKSNKK